MESTDQQIDIALRHFNEGRFGEACTACRQVLSSTPHNVMALYLLGTILLKTQQFEEAVDVLQTASGIAPHVAGLYVTKGVGLRALGRLEEAAAAYEKSVELDSTNADAHLNLGNCYKDLGRYKNAENAYNRCIEIHPKYALAYDNLGICLREQNRNMDALEAFRTAIDICPDLPTAHNNIGVTLLLMERIEEAKSAFLKAVEADPTDHRAWNNLADVERRLGNVQDALRLARQAVEMDSTFGQAYINAGLCAAELGNHFDAAGYYQQGLMLLPHNVDARYNYARSLRCLQQYDEARDELEEVIRCRPDFSAAHNALGALYHELLQIDKAAACYEEAMRLDPEATTPKWNRGLLYLLTGDYSRGFKEMKWRDDQAREQNWCDDIPEWTGAGSLNGARLLIRAEHGFGDTVHFARFIPMLTQQGAHVTLFCQPGLGGLLRASNLDCDVFEDISHPNADLARNNEKTLAASDFDLQVWMLSVPGLLGVGMDDLDDSMIPYLNAPRESVNRWRQALDAEMSSRFRPNVLAGLVWAGSRKNTNNHQRTILLEQFEPLGELERLGLVSVQQGPAVTQIPAWCGGTPLLVPKPTIRNFVDTAGLISNLDVVITVDTSVAHIAGALDIPVWLLIPYSPDWRWGMHGESTVWYPSVRLFRQPSPGDWDTVMESVVHAAEKLIAAKTSASTKLLAA